MKIDAINDSLERYSDVASAFIQEFRLPREWFLRPDHVAIKCANELDYLDTCDELLGFMENGIEEIEINDRLIGSGNIDRGIELDLFKIPTGKMYWVEIMQPRRGKEQDEGFVEHSEFTFPDFHAVERWLTPRGISYERQGNDGHDWINIVLDEEGREIKINDLPLLEVLSTERRQGLLRKIGGLQHGD